MLQTARFVKLPREEREDIDEQQTRRGRGSGRGRQKRKGQCPLRRARTRLWPFSPVAFTAWISRSSLLLRVFNLEPLTA